MSWRKWISGGIGPLKIINYAQSTNYAKSWRAVASIYWFGKAYWFTKVLTCWPIFLCKAVRLEGMGSEYIRNLWYFSFLLLIKSVPSVLRFKLVLYWLLVLFLIISLSWPKCPICNYGGYEWLSKWSNMKSLHFLVLEQSMCVQINMRFGRNLERVQYSLLFS